ncbi:STAS domain-containing protein [Geodermatophilus sp. SYSU D01180]
MTVHPEDVRPLPGSITVREEDGSRVLCLRGEVDTAVAVRFKERQGRAPLLVDVIDAAGVSFISSTAVSVLARCVEASHAVGRRPLLRAASPIVERILQLSGLQGDFDRPPAPSGRSETPG